jgi:hypothetical protein
VTQTSGWGSLPWGAGPWGAGGADDLELSAAEAIRENVFRLTFNVAPQFTKLLTPNDAANPKRFQVTALPLPLGADGMPARAVLPVLVERAKVPGSFGAVLDLTVDRPMSPWPARYIVAVNQLVSVEGALLLPGATSKTVVAVYRALRPQNAATPSPSRDIANPQTYLAQLDPIPQAGDPLALGVIPLDASGDYAFDEGVTQLKKRVIRRLLTTKGAFPAIPNYGIGIPSYGKKLGTAAIRQQLCEEAMTQLKLEPDVADVRVTAFSDPRTPSVTVFRIRIRVAGSQGNVTFDVPFAPV